MFRSRPLAVLAAGLVLGIAVAWTVEIGILGTIVALAAACFLLRWRHPALIFLLGAGVGALRQEVSGSAPEGVLAGEIIGAVDGPPHIYRSLEDPDSGPSADGSFVVDGVQVRFYRRSVPLIGGERVRVRGRMRLPRPPTNPGQFDYAAHLERRGIHAIMTLDEMEVLEGPPATSRFRAGLRSLFDRGMRPEVAALQGALVLGRREAVPDDLVRDLQRSGTTHLLAISGQHLVLVMVAGWTILTLAGLRGALLSAILLAVLGAYVALVGFPVSAVRSYLIMAAYFGADLAWRRRDALSALGAAATIICLWDPAQVAEPGFQLSFAAVLGLGLITPVFTAFAGPGAWAWSRFRAMAGVSVATWLATAPIVLANFNLVTPCIVLSNLILVPLLSAELLIGLFHLVAAPLGAGGLTGTLSEILFDASCWISGAITALPGSFVYAPALPAGLVAAYGAALAGWTAWCRRTPPRAWKVACVAGVAALLGLGGLRHRAPEGLRVAVLDVGRGSCAYLEWPDGRNLMVDCGSLDLRDPGESIAARYLWARGVTRVDTLALSHPDQDHVNGADSMIELFGIRRVLVSRAFPDRDWPPGVDVVRVERVGDPVRIGDLEILGPPAWEKYGGPASTNDDSIVLRVDGVLIPGDVQDRGVEELLTLPDLRARVLVMPHHGKFFKRHEEFVRRVGPETVLVSAPEGYFSSRVVEALPVPAQITGREGAIELEIK